MSTKIYNAYRFPRKHLDEFILLFNKLCHQEVKKFLQKFTPEPEFLQKEREKTFAKYPESAQYWSDKDFAAARVFGMAMVASKSPYKEVFDLDCSFNLWMHKGYCYVIPYVPNTFRINWKRLPKWCKFYGYWDNTDEEEGVSIKEWKQRGKMWEEIALNDWDKTRLTHIVLDLKMPTLNGFQSLLKFLGGNKKFPGRKNETWTSVMYGMSSRFYWKFYQEDKEREDQETFDRMWREKEEEQAKAEMEREAEEKKKEEDSKKEKERKDVSGKKHKGKSAAVHT